MNRIILIGNGFDLAHGMATRYQDFIDWFWEKQGEECNKIRWIDERPLFNKNNLYFSFKEFPNHQLQGQWYKEFIKKGKLIFKNVFLEIITKDALQSWVDIEEAYNKELHKIIEKVREYEKEDIEKLNNDFSMIKNALENYLKEVVEKDNNVTFENIRNTIYSRFDLKDFTRTGVDNIVDKECQVLQQFIEGKRFPSGNAHYLLNDLKDRNVQVNKKEIKEGSRLE
ncbi:MAG: bacteriophage abortive infection AbiH family protein [Bacteroidales bacterium]|nr:bacteriophage abortive infection AbiH family protein [Bacteroidales bacterium]